MPQAIETKYLAPTNTKGSRIQVSSEAGRKTYGYDYSLDTTDNHDKAAEKYARALGWLEGHKLESGSLKRGAVRVHVLVPK
jgi:hypothetical protein